MMDEKTIRPKFLTINSIAKWKKVLHANNTDTKNLTFASDGSISLPSKLSPKIETQHKILFKDIVDLSSDSCGLLYLLYENQGKFGIQVLNTVTGFSELFDYDEFVNPKSIEANNTSLFVLDGNSIKTISRTTHKIINTATIPGIEFVDLCMDNSNALFVLGKNKHLYKLEEQNFELVLMNNFSLEKNISDSILRCSVGKEDNKFYFLNDNNTFFIYHDSGKYDSSVKDSPSGSITDFDVLDRDNIMVILEDGTTKQFHHTQYDSDDPFGLFDHVIINKNRELFLFKNSTAEAIQYNFKKKYTDQTVYVTDSLDSSEKHTNWNRIVLDANIPDNTSIKISYFASDDKNTISKNPQWLDTLPDPTDSLIDAQGKYLWLRITLLTLDGENTPCLKSLTVFFPKFSYMQFLPEVYSTADISNNNVLERFLSMFGTIQTDLDEKIFSFTKYLDPGSVPRSFLNWLISWFGMKTDENWPEEKLRNLLLLLPKYYKMRGTRLGLDTLLSLLLQDSHLTHDSQNVAYLQSPDADKSFFRDDKFLIIESFQLYCARNSHNWDDYQRLFQTNPYSFTVLINSLTVNKDMIGTINKTIDAEKPAYVVAKISTVDPSFQLGSYVFLGVNTFLNKQVLSIGSSMMGQDSLIGEQKI